MNLLGYLQKHGWRDPYSIKMTWEDTDKGIDIVVDYIDKYNSMVVLLVYTYE